MKKHFTLLFMAASLFMVACSSDDEGYNADTAISHYTPMPQDDYRMVQGIKMTQLYNGRNFTWDYTFDYDAQNRIKNVNCDVTTFAKDNSGKYHKVTGAITMNYIFESENIMKIHTTITSEPQGIINEDSEYKYAGEFSNDGRLTDFAVFGCEYSMGGRLSKAYMDNERVYSMSHDGMGNITGYRCDSVNKVLADYPNKYEYSVALNKTNIDIAGFMGNCVIEREIPGNENEMYPIVLLSAFDMLGQRSPGLPKGEWSYDAQGSPVKGVLSDGIELNIRYRQ